MKKISFLILIICSILAAKDIQAAMFHVDFQFCDQNGNILPNYPSVCDGGVVYVKNLSYIQLESGQIVHPTMYYFNEDYAYVFRNYGLPCCPQISSVSMASWSYGQVIPLNASCCGVSSPNHQLTCTLNNYGNTPLPDWNGEDVYLTSTFDHKGRYYNVTCLSVDAGNNQTFCAMPIPTNIQLNGQSNGTTHVWSPTTGLSNPNILNPTVDVSAIPASITYTLTSSKNGCSKSDNVTLVKNIISVNLGPDQLICSGQSVSLNAGNPGYNYLWSTGAATQTITANTVGTYCVTVTHPNTGCTGSDCVSIGFYKNPNASFTHAQNCVNCVEQISVTASGSATYTHNWELWSSNSSGAYISLLATGSGLNYTFSSGITYNAYYQVKHNVTGPCGSTTSSHLVFVTPTVIDPEFDLVKVAGETNDHYHLQATAHSIPSCAQFWWSISDITNGTPSDVMENPSNWWASSQIPSTWFPGYCCNPSQSIGEGTFYYGRIYRIERGVWSGCSPWTSYYTDFTARFGKSGNGEGNDLQIIASGSVVHNMDVKGLADNAIRFYPNPSEGILNLEYDFTFVSGTSIAIVNSLGQVVYSNDSELPATIDLSGQSKGVYYVKLKYKDNVLVKKLLLQ